MALRLLLSAGFSASEEARLELLAYQFFEEVGTGLKVWLAAEFPDFHMRLVFGPSQFSLRGQMPLVGLQWPCFCCLIWMASLLPLQYLF